MGRPIAVREELNWFAGQMEATLRRNDYKGGWEHCEGSYLLERLRAEVDELEARTQFSCVTALSRAAVVREACDVANFAMMIATQLR